MTAPKWTGRRAAEMTARVLERDGYRCQLRLSVCVGTATSADHIVPKSRAPELTWALSNLQAACGPCNSSKKDGLHEGPAVDHPDWATGS